jgi:hypothetical protein
MIDDTHLTAPVIDLTENICLYGICDWMWFGRFRRDFDVEQLTGDVVKPPILRPIEMASVAARVKIVIKQRLRRAMQ